MNPKELRIGNYVLFRNHNEVATVLIIKEIAQYAITSTVETGNHFVHYSKLEGVPITEEFIAENFEKHAYGSFGLNGHGYLEIEDGKFHLLLGGFSGLKKEVKYVHELQNILFDIAGIEI